MGPGKTRMLSLILLILISCTAFSQDKDVSEMSLEELLNAQVYSATKRSTEALKVSSHVTVISGEELTKWGAQNLAEGLRFAPGISVREAPGDFPRFQISLRGNSSDFLNVRTLFLIDGVPVRNPNAGFDPAWIPLSIVKRVEIVKGANSSLWGANAFGGIINVITKSGGEYGKGGGDLKAGYELRHDHLQNKLIGGENLSGTWGQELSKVDYVVSAQYDRAGKSGQNYSGHTYQDVFGKMSYQASDKLALSATSLVSFDRNQQGLLNADEPMESDMAHVTASADYNIDKGSNIRITGFTNTFRHYLNYSDDLEKSDNSAIAAGVQTQYSTERDKHAFIGGLDFIYEAGELDTLANDFSTFPPVIQEAGWDKRHQNTFSGYGQYEYHGWEKLRPIAGLRYDNNSLYGDALSPRVGFSYLINENYNLFSSIGRAFRAPVFNETHINGYGKVGDKNLNPEWITTYEVGLKSVSVKSQYTLSLFKQDLSDKIDLEFIDPGNPNSLQTYHNQGGNEITGIELEGSYALHSNLRTFYNILFLEVDDEGDQLTERIVEKRFVLGMEWTVETWMLGLIGLHEGKQFYFNTNSSIEDDSKNRVFVPAQTTGNIYFRKSFNPSTSFTIYMNNFTNLKYKQRFSSFIEQDALVLPGRTMGLSFSKCF